MRRFLEQGYRSLREVSLSHPYAEVKVSRKEPLLSSHEDAPCLFPCPWVTERSHRLEASTQSEASYPLISSNPRSGWGGGRGGRDRNADTINSGCQFETFPQSSVGLRFVCSSITGKDRLWAVPLTDSGVYKMSLAKFHKTLRIFPKTLTTAPLVYLEPSYGTLGVPSFKPQDRV